MITRLLLFITLLTFCAGSRLAAQAYQPMPDGPARWDVSRCWYFYPAGWYDRFYIEADDTDTLINNRLYHKLYHTTHHAPGTEFDSTYTHFLGGYREADKKIYMISEYLCLDTIERLIYDFNETDIGDTIYTQVLTNGLTQFFPHILTAIDSIEINGAQHRRLHVQDDSGFFTDTWTEGMGSHMGLVYASYWILSDNSYDLNCFYTDDELAYHNSFPNYAFCTAPFPPDTCALSTSNDPDITPDDVVIFPNPSSLRFKIDTKAKFDRLAMYNVVGIRVMERSFTQELDVAHLAPGVYWISLESDYRTYPVIKKVVIQ